MSILDLLGIGGPHRTGGPSGETESVRRIVTELSGMPPDEARHLAAFAYILGRVASADRVVSDDEIAEMRRIVAAAGGLPDERAALVVDIARNQADVFGGTENFLVTREFSRIASREEKIRLLECLFAVAASDGSISTVESTVIRQISDEILLDRSDYIRARSAFRDRLAVLKRDDG